MAVFANSEELYAIMIPLWEAIKADKKMSEQLIRTKMIVQFCYRDPDAVITIDCSKDDHLEIIRGQGPEKPTIEMSMKADVAHEFWMGRVTVPVAILTGKIVSKGPTPKALSLLPVIRPAFSIYPRILEQAGKQALITQ
jgi:hypothetical protein